MTIRPNLTSIGVSILALMAIAAPAKAQLPPPAKPIVVGPYNAEFPAGGDGIAKPIPGYTLGEALNASTDWTLTVWVKPERIAKGRAIVAGIGTPGSAAERALALVDGAPALIVGDRIVAAGAMMAIGRWHYVAAVVHDDTVRLLVDGRDGASGALSPSVQPTAVVSLGPRTAPGAPVFTGRLAQFEATPDAIAARVIADRARTPPNDDLIAFETGSPTWPLQIRQQYGELVPQKAWTLPKGFAPPSRPVAKPVPDLPPIVAEGDGRFTVNGWRLAAAPDVAAQGRTLSQPGFDARRWYAATVPGTVLTTLIDRGVYPDPTIGLNNLAIPEKLARQDYWYRTEFTAPADGVGRHRELIFKGVNYAAEVWLNGERLGEIKGAFIRGRFDVTGKLIAGAPNALAVRISPPPHPGIPHEQSITGSRGENGGMMMIDGPTFFATEGWDWIPGIRDRNSGLWQGVEIAASGDVTLGDAHIVTMLPRADNSVANITIAAPVTNHGDRTVAVTVRAAFDDIAVAKTVTVAAGAVATVSFDPAAFPQLAVRHPKLWWPNGYGDPALHALRLEAAVDGAPSDARTVRFGMRDVAYELSAMDQGGDLRRVLFDPARAPGSAVIDQRQNAIRKVANGWAPSLYPGAMASPAIQPIAEAPTLSPHLVLRVNGVRIAVRGGNIGMDDMLKRVGRDRLEPMFRLQHEAHMNIIRNWCGQNTEDVLYDLADEYGLMVFNDFWESTQDNDAESEDVPLFLANARDVVRRYQTHPSVVAWIGRNEGVPQPILNQGLQDMIRAEDGARLYMANSRLVNLAGSGPYNWREPETYFTDHAKGFAVEIGTPSFPTLESWQRAIPAADRWPINDNWAYHDWHQERGGSVKTFMDALAVRFGPGTSLEDFEKKAQMLEYESYRAIFEGMNAGLWTTTSGRMLWMTQPAWPSTHWQIFSSDLDTHAAFYATRKGAEPVHVQMNLPDRKVILVNTTRTPLTGARVTARFVTIDGRPIGERSGTLDVAAGVSGAAFTLDLADALGKGPVLVRLEARAADGALLSDNFYWQTRDPAGMQALTTMTPAPLTLAARASAAGVERTVDVTLSNRSMTPALEAKLTLFGANGRQILPAYFSDNYVSLLPGETRTVTVRYPATGDAAARIDLRGWNIVGQNLAVGAP
jgi:hypothetical protein